MEKYYYAVFRLIELDTKDFCLFAYLEERFPCFALIFSTKGLLFTDLIRSFLEFAIIFVYSLFTNEPISNNFQW